MSQSACVAELYGIDATAAYPLVYAYVRQLALLLRQALTAKSKEAFRQARALRLFAPPAQRPHLNVRNRK